MEARWSAVTWAEAYPTVYRSLAPEYRGLPAEQVDRLLAGVLGPGAGLEYAESFLGDVGSALGQIGKVVVKALPGAISGAISGAPAGLPGIIGGALIGGAGSVLAGGSTPAAQPAPAATTMSAAAAAPTGQAAATPASPATPTSPATPATPASPAGTPGAASDAPLVQLLTALSSPTVRDAITAMLLGGAGARTVSTATGAEVPAAAVTNMLGTLSARASAEWDAIGPRPAADHLAVAGYAESVDAANPEARAAWLYGQLAPTEDLDDGFDDGFDDVYDDLEAQLQMLAESDGTGNAGIDDGFDDGFDAPLARSAAADPAETVGRWWQ
jgi:hypothetical protein